jgi:hypothetical protein
MLARCGSAALRGLEALPVTVEVDIAPGLPGLQMPVSEHPTAPSVHIKACIPANDREELERQATAGCRSLSGQIIWLIREEATRQAEVMA